MITQTMFGTPIHAKLQGKKKACRIYQDTLCEEGRSIKHKMVVQQPLSGLHTERGRKAEERTSLAMENGPSLLRQPRADFQSQTLKIT
jgi:hypothetical protein